MKKLLILLDPAHGVDTPGKRSPDGLHREYNWSRERLLEIYKALVQKGYSVEFTTVDEKEPGLSVRVKNANSAASRNKNLVPLFVSLHNDAAGDGTKWMQARGVSVWTSKGRTRSDIFAGEMLKELDVITKNRTKLRTYSPTEKDFEANFNVLMGNYSAMLIECCFQDNKEDVACLADPTFNKSVEVAIVNGIERINDLIK